MIGIIGAMDEEVAMLKEKLTEVQVETKAAMDFYKGKLEGKDVVVVRSGIGKVNAAMCAQILADVYHADHVINTGIAGSLKAEINIGDIVLSTDALQHDMDAQAFGYEPGQIPRVDTLSFKADEKNDRSCKKSAAKKVKPGDRRIYKEELFPETSSFLIKRRRNGLLILLQATAQKMEGAAIAQVCYLTIFHSLL